MKKQIRDWISALLLLLLCFVLVNTTSIFKDGQNAITAFNSSINKRPASGNTVFVAIDSASLDHIGQWPWPRGVHANIVERLVENEVADIAFDIDFSSKSTPAEDDKFASALKKADGSVILAAFQQSFSIENNLDKLKYNLPIEKFLENSWPASVNVSADEDGIIRRFSYGQMIDGRLLPSLPNMLSSSAITSTDDFQIDYSIDPESVPVFSVKALLKGEIAKSQLKGKNILIGVLAVELRDTFAVPVHGLLPGALLQIISAETLSQNRVLKNSHPITDYTLAILLFLLCLRLTSQMKLYSSVATLFAIGSVLIIVAATLQSKYGLILCLMPSYFALLGNLIFAVSSELDIRKFLLAISQKETTATKAILSQVVSDNFDAIIVCDDKGLLQVVSKQANKLFASDLDIQMINKPVEALLPEQICADIKLVIDDHFGGKTASSEFAGKMREWQNDASNGNKQVIEYVITPTLFDNKNTKNVEQSSGNLIICVTARDITKLRCYTKKMEYLAKYDAQSGAYLRNELRHIISNLDESNGALLAFNIKRLSIVNGLFGRTVGDALIKVIADTIQIEMGSDYSLTRLAGDSFALNILDASSLKDIVKVSTKLNKLFSSPLSVQGHKIQVEIHSGASGSWQNFENAEDYIQAAETAVENARAISDGKLVIFDPAQAKDIHQAQLIERHLQGALSNQEIECFYQPQIDLKTGNFIGAEALVRWNSKEIGQISPAHFIPIAEKNGSIIQIGNFVLQQACCEAASWEDHTEVSVNVSSIQIKSGSLVKDVTKALGISGLPAHRLCIELTESVFIDGDKSAIADIEKLQAMGVKIALDDFGTGYSSFEYLTWLPIDKLKIDQCFIRQSTTNEKSKSIVLSMLSMASNLGIETVAEGVEHLSEHLWLAGTDCSIGQGYMYGRPVPASALNRKLKIAA